MDNATLRRVSARDQVRHARKRECSRDIAANLAAANLSGTLGLEPVDAEGSDGRLQRAAEDNVYKSDIARTSTRPRLLALVGAALVTSGFVQLDAILGDTAELSATSRTLKARCFASLLVLR